MAFVEKVKGFLIEPSKTFDAYKQETLGDAMKYYAIIIAIFSAIYALLFAFFSSLLGSMMSIGAGMMTGFGIGVAGGIAIFVAMLVSFIVIALIGGAILHIFVYIAGGKKGLTQTIKAFMYASTPILIAWIPLIGLIAGVWSLILYILGIRQLHEMTTGRAIVAAIIPFIIIPVALILLAVIAAFIFAVGPG